MNSTPEEIDPHDALIARTDGRLAHVHEQLALADEQLARVTEQLTKMERDSTRSVPAGPPSLRTSLTRPGLALVGLPLAAFIVVATLVFFFGGGAKLIAARWAPQPVSTPSSPPENPSFSAQPAPSTVEVAATEATRPQATPLAQIAPQDAAPTAAAAPTDHTQSQQTMAPDLAIVERDIEQLKAKQQQMASDTSKAIEQLKASQQQMASDTSKAIEQLKASQEEMKRVLARVSEQNPPKTSPPPTQPTRILRKPERTLPLRHARAHHRIPREEDEEYYSDSDWW